MTNFIPDTGNRPQSNPPSPRKGDGVIDLFSRTGNKYPRLFHGSCQRCERVDFLPWATEHGVRYCGHRWEADAMAYAAERGRGPVKLERSKEWWMRSAEREGNHAVGAGQSNGLPALLHLAALLRVSASEDTEQQMREMMNRVAYSLVAIVQDGEATTPTSPGDSEKVTA